jgi:phosphoenolpyruvate carboxykinase (ATP)
MFIQINDLDKLANHVPAFTILHVPSFQAVPSIDGTNSEVFVVVDYSKQMVLIGGTNYAGEIKKSVFSVLNYLLPKKHSVLSMHCSANIGSDGDSAVFFGLSGTGKTTLSADPNRELIGDDEHGWSDKGVFNFEGGCYAKVIRLSKEAEPEIYQCTRQFGTILENVVMDPVTRRLNLDDASLTENTRASYPITHIKNAVPDGMGANPKQVIMLTCDAYGVMPPVAKMTPEQAMYHFISGYTAKVAGTERGITEPVAAFSACFGEAFLPLHPTEYAKLLGDKIDEHGVNVYLVNTGWTGGPCEGNIKEEGVTYGSRMSIKDTRACIHDILNGSINDAEFETLPLFNLQIPKKLEGVHDNAVLNPRNMWKDKAKYDESLLKLAGMFKENFNRYNDNGSEFDYSAAGPKV